MIVASLLLILVAVTLLVFGVAGGSSMLLISSIVASLLAAIALVAGARRASARRAAARDVGAALRPASGSASRTGGRDAADAGGGSPHAESAAFADRTAPTGSGAVAYAAESGAVAYAAESGAVAYAAESGASVPGAAVTYADEPDASDPAGSVTYPDEADAPASGSARYADLADLAGDDEFATATADSGTYLERDAHERPGADAADADPLDTGAADYMSLSTVAEDPAPGYADTHDAPGTDRPDLDRPDLDLARADALGSVGTEPDDDHTGHRDHLDYDRASSVIDAARTQDPDESWRREPAAAAEHLDTVEDRPAATAFGAGPAFDGRMEEFGEPDPDDPADEPLPQAERAADAVRIARMDAEVLVVDGRPRYHVPDCPHLVGRLTEPLPVAEAVELGFTPCGLCRPVDRLLAAAARG
ncbi:clumping factor A [Krasilnikovia cinnamomea]|uniref:Clumping factor A n=1 Tax=Krasilnikovia cinnamomea TaxID=349313 RepID=A0A4Q7ZQC4_9ACTN|nr:hypothetical protein [Krasilnikovia cinnamomea]RZU52964.1 clumping factor A [Krasilnikovia cinnamomea]